MSDRRRCGWCRQRLAGMEFDPGPFDGLRGGSPRTTVLRQAHRGKSSGTSWARGSRECQVPPATLPLGTHKGHPYRIERAGQCQDGFAIGGAVGSRWDSTGRGRSETRPLHKRGRGLRGRRAGRGPAPTKEWVDDSTGRGRWETVPHSAGSGRALRGREKRAVPGWLPVSVVRHGPAGTPARLTTNGGRVARKTGGSGTRPYERRGRGRRG